ncbi:MAG: class I SAM-dependent methyltransferase [Acidobacteria bacterium]|nr:class I SAM-dependent methyltransferase [Acidobacteriota bacterium]
MLRKIKDGILAVPWIYDRVRPLAAGGIDFEALASFCATTPEDRVFDLGCGTGQLLPYLRFHSYLGADLDPQALRRASRLASASVSFVAGDDWDRQYFELEPTVVLMIGVVHHLSDAAFRRIVERLSPPQSLRRIVTIDVTYLPDQWLNNLLSRMDRGRHVRTPQAYEKLFEFSGLKVTRGSVLPTRLRYVRYVGYHLTPERVPR